MKNDRPSSSNQDIVSDKRHSRARRRLLQSLAASGTAVTVKALPQNWAKPVLDATLLPVHAVSTCVAETVSCQVSTIDHTSNDSGPDLPGLPLIGGNNNTTDGTIRGIVDPGNPECGSLAQFDGITDQVSLAVSATVNPPCAATLLASLADTDGVYSLESPASQPGVVDPVTGVVAFPAVLVGIDVAGFTVETNNQTANADLDLRVRVAGVQDCIIDIRFTEGFFCQEPAICLATGTPILRSGSHYEKIEDLEIGDLVAGVSRDGTRIYTVVTKVIRQHMRKDHYVINGTLKITDDHPVLIQKDDASVWCRVDGLNQGDQMRTLNGTVPVREIEYRALPLETVYIATQCGNFIAAAGGENYIVKSDYAEAAERLERGQHKVFA